MIHEDTGGKVQKEKVSIYSWKWETQIAINKPTNSELKNEMIKQPDVKISIKKLGVHANSSLD